MLPVVRLNTFIKIASLSVWLTQSIGQATAQCSSTISSFPYAESFETSNGGWFPGGTSSDWAWGTPAKPVISGPASGSKCWITGTLNQSFYANYENSTLTSPCFNFSSLTAPYLRFKVFWETENKYDGASLQYSIDGGNNWILLGSYSDYTSCPGDNWFNTSSITALGSAGWSGNIQTTSPCTGGSGNGSGGWRVAQHELFALAGQPNVQFRFRFAAGSICNNYDGFAIDDIWIGEATPLSSDFSFTCSNNNTVSFIAATSSCSALFSWNFDDPSSGASNTSTLANPIHVFSGPGQYNVSLSIEFGLSPPPVIKQVNIAAVSTSIIGSIQCNGDKTGIVMANVLPAASYTYQWSTNPLQSNPVATGLAAGTYSVMVSSAQSCPASASITLTEPGKLQHQLVTSDPLCGFSNGSASVQVSGGTPPYSYSWSPLTGSASSYNALPPNDYRVIVTDNNNCRDTADFTLINQNPLKISLGNDTLICPGQLLLLNPGSYLSYQWQDNSSTPIFTVSQTGQYFVTVTDNMGCTASDTINVTVDCSDLFFPTAFTPNADGRNDFFGPLGNLLAVSQYSFRVYNRWGQQVFHSDNPYQKWNGNVGGSLADNNFFAWYAEYTLPGRGRIFKKGVVALVK